MATVDEGKVSKTHVEPVESQKPMVANIDDDPVYSYREQRKIIRRIDARLIVMLGFLHTVSLIDRGNLGTAAIAGMEKELRLHGTQYVGFLAIAVVSHEAKTITEHNCSGLLPSLYLSTNLRANFGPQDWSHSVSLRCLFSVGSCYGEIQLYPHLIIPDPH
jgi:hypothetical protein